MPEKFTVNVPFEFDEHFIENVLTSALEGGSNYWIASGGVKTVEDMGTAYHAEDVSKGGVISILPDEDPGIKGVKEGTPFILGRPDFIRGFQKYLAWGFASGRAVYTDAGMIDATEADVILQMALFGEIVFS